MNKKLRNAITLTILLAAMIVITHLASSCQLQQAPKHQFLAAQKVYCATVDSLTTLKQQGKFSEKDTAGIILAVDEGAALLSQWKAAIDAGQPTLDYYTAFQGVLDKMLAYQNRTQTTDP